MAGLPSAAGCCGVDVVIAFRRGDSAGAPPLGVVTRSMPPSRKKRGGWPGDGDEFPATLDRTWRYGSPDPHSVARNASCFVGYRSGSTVWLTRARLIRLLLSSVLHFCRETGGP